VGVGAYHVGQCVRVAGVALGSAHRVPFPETCDLTRVDGEDRVTGGDQRGDPGSAVGLDADPDLLGCQVVRGVLADQLVELGDPGDAFGQAGLGQPASGAVLDLDVVVVLGPVVTDEQHCCSLLPAADPVVCAAAGDHQRTNGSVLAPKRGGLRHPVSGQLSRPPAGALS
jgi:hypothetical protein